MEYCIVPAKEVHVDDIYEVQTMVYEPCLWESKETIHRILSMQSSLVVVQNDKVIGYTLAHFIEQEPPVLDTVEVCETSLCFFIHDMCISVLHQKCGIGKHMFDTIVNMMNSRTVKQIKLVALHNSVAYWKNKCFEECETSEVLRACYGIHAKVMQLNL